MNKTFLTVVTAILLVLLASNAFASIALLPSAEQANISRNDSVGIQFQLKNNGYERACIDLETEQNAAYIDTGLIDNYVCLNGGESTNVTVTITTENAPKGLQLVTLEAESDQGNAYANVSIYVSEEPEIELVAYTNDVCRGKKDHVNVLVRNNSDEFKEVELQAENEMLLPYFEREELDMAPFEERYVELKIFPSPYSSIGRHYISMYAITDGEIVKETLSIDVENCGEKDIAEFSVSISSSCFTVEKEEDERIYFKVTNKLEEEQNVFFSVGGDLSAKLQTSNAWLEEGEQREFYFEVNVAKDKEVKDYDLTLHVWNSDHSIEKNICIKPSKEHYTDIVIEENNLEIIACENTVFVITLQNFGDYREDFELEIENNNNLIETALSEDELEVEKHSKRQVYVSVTALEGLAEGNYSIILKAETNHDKFEKILRFKVVEEQIVEEKGLVILSHTGNLTMDANSEKELLVVLKNYSNKTIEGISINLTGLPLGVSASNESNISLQAGEERQFSLTVNAETETAGEYTAILQARNSDYSDTKNISIVIAEEEKEDETIDIGLAGLFALGEGLAIGGLMLIIIIIASILLVKVFKTPQEKEIWRRQLNG